MVLFITACVLVLPTKEISYLNIIFIKKKWKDKAFAKGVSREQIQRATDDLSISLDDHLQTVLEAMRANADKLGLAG